MNQNKRILRRIALLLVLVMLFSANAFAVVQSNGLDYYNDALAKQKGGNYYGALAIYFSSLEYFTAHSEEVGNDTNKINVYSRIAECYSAMGEYSMAASAYRSAEELSTALAENEPKAAAQPAIAAPIVETPVAAEPVVETPVAAEPVVEEPSVFEYEDARDTELYLKSNNPELGDGTYFGVSGEPVNGFVVGAYAEIDERVHDPYGEERYWDLYPAATGVETGVYQLYMDYWMPLSHYETHVNAAKEKGFAIELSLQPRTGLDAVHADDLALMQLARDIEASGVQFYIRFAAEMNDTSGGNPWYTENAAEFIRAFRAVATVFHTYAPSAAMVWAPNFAPSDNITAYYPGDEYVDIVGISLYVPYSVENEGSLRWVDELETIYSLYGDRKPIIISEGAVCFATVDGRDLSDFAAQQTRDLFTYLPIRFPNVKMMVWFDAAVEMGNEAYSCLTANETVLNAYRETLLASESMLHSVDAPAASVYYGRLANGSTVAKNATLCSYIERGMSVASVRYAVNGKTLGTSSKAPYEIKANLSDYSGRNVKITVSAYDADGALLSEDSFVLCVEGTSNAVRSNSSLIVAPPERAVADIVCDGIAYERTIQVELNGKPVTLSAYAIRNEQGHETNYVSLRELATALSGTAAQFNVGWDGAINIETGSAYDSSVSNTAKLTGDRAYRVNTAQTRIDGTAASLAGILLTDDNGGGYTYFMLRDLGQALGFTVDWSLERGIYIET